MVVGDKYEMYIPRAELLCKQVGLCFDDTVGYSFTYTGALVTRKGILVCSPDVYYYGSVLTTKEIEGGHVLRKMLEGSTMVCSALGAGDCIRPVTDE